MDYEKKYKEALEVAKRKLCFDKAGMVDSFTPNDIYEMFPELKESEDERTWIINYLSNRILNSTIIVETENLKKAIAWLERQGEQKPAEKVEPKFKVGDWVVIDGEVLHVREVTEDGYLTDEGGLIPFRNEKEAHIWAIDDAKDGDVLVTGRKNIFIFESISGYTIYDYCGLFLGNFEDFAATVNGIAAEQLPVDYVPATKEQRDVLMKAMADAGYEWDSKKKELKKIAAPIFHIGDRVRYKGHACDGVITEITNTDYICGNAKLPISTQDKLELVEQKSAWSEEDVNRFNNLIYLVENSNEGKGTKEGFVKFINRLKSLRPQNRWKPSDLPRWKKSILPNDNTTGFNSDYFCHKGYCINYKQLFEKLPKDD